jgi:hypothetical protein
MKLTALNDEASSLGTMAQTCQLFRSFLANTFAHKDENVSASFCHLATLTQEATTQQAKNRVIIYFISRMQ